MPDIWHDYVETVRAGLSELARNTVGDALAEAQADAGAFLASARARLERWLRALGDRALDPVDFEFLLRGQHDLMRLHALTAIGLARARLERFRTGLISLLVSSAFRVVGPADA